MNYMESFPINILPLFAIAFVIFFYGGFFIVLPFLGYLRYRRDEDKAIRENNLGSIFAGKIKTMSVEQLGEHTNSYTDTILVIHPEHFYENISIDRIRGYFYYDTWDKPAAIWIHYERWNAWQIMKIEINAFDKASDVKGLLAALSIVTEPEVKLAYARKPPYVHRDLTSAHTARQRITGDWELLAPIQLYLMPTYLVLLDDNGIVQRKISTELIDSVEAQPRMEDNSTGILRFRAQGELFTFALKGDYEAWADDLALAASKAQEIPLEAEFLELKKKHE